MKANKKENKKVQRLADGKKRNKKEIESIYDILKMPMSEDIQKEHDTIRKKYGLPPIKKREDVEEA
jgi:hypothetical protein